MSDTEQVLGSLNIHTMGDSALTPEQNFDVAITRIAEAMVGTTALSLASGGAANFNATADQIRGAVIVLSGATAERNVVVPALPFRRMFVNSTAYDLVVKCAATTGVTLPALSSQDLYCDGTTVKSATIVEDDGAGTLQKDVAGGVDVTLDAEESENLNLEFVGVLTANINVVVPSPPRLYFVKNSTSGAFTLTVKTLAGTGVTVAAGETELLLCDGVNVEEFTSGSGSGGSLPAGGDTGEVLAKLSNDDGDAGWVDVGTISLPGWLANHPDAPPSSAPLFYEGFESAISGWTDLNAGTGVSFNVQKSHLVMMATSADDNLFHAKFAPVVLPATYKVSSRICFEAPFHPAYAGLVLRSGTETIIWGAICISGAWHYLAGKFSGTSYNANITGLISPSSHSGDWVFEVEDDGTDLIYRVSDHGIYSREIARHGRSAQTSTAPTEVGLGLLRQGAAIVVAAAAWFKVE